MSINKKNNDLISRKLIKSGRDYEKYTYKIWNDNFKKLLKKREMSQSEFAEKYCEMYNVDPPFGVGQINKWANVGSNRQKTFPALETMYNIASFFGVSVGYMIGETDYTEYSNEKICEQLHLTEEAVIALRRDKMGLTRRFDDYGFNLSKVLSSENFYRFVDYFDKYEHIFKQHLINERKLLQNINDITPEDIENINKYDEYDYTGEFKNECIDEELFKKGERFIDTNYSLMAENDKFEININAFKYDVHNFLYKIIDEAFDFKNIPSNDYFKEFID